MLCRSRKNGKQTAMYLDKKEGISNLMPVLRCSVLYLLSDLRLIMIMNKRTFLLLKQLYYNRIPINTLGPMVSHKESGE